MYIPLALLLGRLLQTLDTLGKWSMIDAFVLVTMTVAFRIRIAVPPGVV